MNPSSAPLPAILLLLLLLAGALWTLPEAGRCGRLESGMEDAPPSLDCPTGYDGWGRCMARNLAGGTHGLFLPGLGAALTTALLGGLIGLAMGYARGHLRRAFFGIVSAAEALPRLLVLVLVYLLAGPSYPTLGLVLGLTLAPALAWEINGEVRQLEQADFIRAARAHGLPALHVAFYHVLYKRCGRRILQHMVMAFAAMLVAETTLSYALGGGLAAGECGWGLLLQGSLLSIYDALAMAHTAPIPNAAGAHLLSSLAPALSVVGTLVATLWALQRIGAWLSHDLDEVRS